MKTGAQGVLSGFVLVLVALLLLMPLYLGPVVSSPAEELLSNLGNVGRLMQCAWDKCQQRYAADFCDTVLNRLRASGAPGLVGVYIEELGTGFSYGYNAERTWLNDRDEYVGHFLTASVAKLPMAYAACLLADQGTVDLHTAYEDSVLKRSYQYGPLIHEMITRSLNPNFNILLRHFGPELLKQTLLRQGLLHTRLSRELLPAAGSSDHT